MQRNLTTLVRQLLNDSATVSFEQIDALIISCRSDAQLLRRAVSGKRHGIATKYRNGESLTEDERHRLYQCGVRSVRNHAIVKWRSRKVFEINDGDGSISHVRT